MYGIRYAARGAKQSALENFLLILLLDVEREIPFAYRAT